MWSFLPLNAFNSKITDMFVKFTVDRFTEMTSEFSENISSFDSGQLDEMVRVSFSSYTSVLMVGTSCGML